MSSNGILGRIRERKADFRENREYCVVLCCVVKGFKMIRRPDVLRGETGRVVLLSQTGENILP